MELPVHTQHTSPLAIKGGGGLRFGKAGFCLSATNFSDGSKIFKNGHF